MRQGEEERERKRAKERERDVYVQFITESRPARESWNLKEGVRASEASRMFYGTHRFSMAMCSSRRAPAQVCLSPGQGAFPWSRGANTTTRLAWRVASACRSEVGVATVLPGRVPELV
jgi:hypothetical protein